MNFEPPVRAKKGRYDMTNEMKIRRALDQYDDAMAELKKEHQRRFENLPVGDSLEVWNQDILELGMWREQRENEIKRAFIEAMM